jgi:hypothetical protein
MIKYDHHEVACMQWVALRGCAFDPLRMWAEPGDVLTIVHRAAVVKYGWPSNQ